MGARIDGIGLEKERETESREGDVAQMVKKEKHNCT